MTLPCLAVLSHFDATLAFNTIGKLLVLIPSFLVYVVHVWGADCVFILYD